MKTIDKFIIAILSIIILSCSASRVTTYWKKPNIAEKSYNKIMVIGVIHEADRSYQERMENHLVGDLRNLGYNAYSALNEYGPKGFDKLSKEEAYKKLRVDSVDAVITIVLLNKEKERYYVPGRISYSPYADYQHRLWDYYNTMRNHISGPGYYTMLTKYFWESNFYDLDTKDLTYSVQTQSFDPASTESLAHEYGKKIVSNMQKNKILSKHKEGVKKPM